MELRRKILLLFGLPAPTLFSPASNALLTDYTPTFTWETISGATSYEIQIAEDVEFATIVASGTPVAPSFTPGSDLPYHNGFWWRVRVISGGMVGAWSSPRKFNLYILIDEFTTAVSAPLASPRASEPGPGTMVKNADTANNALIASGALQFAGLITSNFNDPMYYWRVGGVGIARAGGRALIARNVIPITNISRAFTFGWSDATGGAGSANHGGVYFSSGGGVNAISGGVLTLGGAWAIATTYQMAVVLLPTGSATFIKGGAFTDWSLLFVEKSFSSSPLFPKITGVANMNVTFDAIRVADLGGAFASDYGIATVRDETLANGDTFVATANGIHDFEFTLPGSPSANNEIALNFRRQDANNKLRAIVKRNAGNTAWDFQVREVVAGTPATPSGWTDVTGVATPAQIRVIADGSTLAFYTRAGTSWTKRGNTITNTNFQSQAGLEIEAVAGTTLTAVTSYPRSTGIYDVLDTI